VTKTKGRTPKRNKGPRNDKKRRTGPRNQKGNDFRVGMFFLACAVVAAGTWFALSRRDGKSPWAAAELPPVMPRNLDDIDKELAEMVAEYVARVEANRGSAEAHGTLGLVYEANDMWQECRQSYTNAARLDPQNRGWAFHAAICQNSASDLDGAREAFEAITRKFPNFAPAFYRLGDALLASGDLQKSEAALQRARQLSPNSAAPLTGLAEIRLRNKDYEGALAFLIKAKKRDPSYRLTRYLLGLTYRGLGQLDQAKKELTIGVDAKKRFLADDLTARLSAYVTGIVSLIEKANGLLDAGQSARGAEMLEGALAAHPNDLNVLNNLSVAYQGMGQYQKALDTLMRADRLDDASFAVKINIVECLIALNRAEEAIPYGELAAELAPTLGQAVFSKGRAFYYAKQYRNALDPLIKAVRLDARNPEAFFHLAECYARLGDFKNARDNFKTTAARMPRNLRVLYRLCEMHMKLGELDQAQKVLDTARKMAPNRKRVRNLTKALEKLRSQ
jgi:tetratricopeptide (TPR) repeat protein